MNTRISEGTASSQRICRDIPELKRLAEAATPGPWHWDSDPLKGDPLDRVRFRVVATGRTITQCYYSSSDEMAQTEAAYIAAANPAAILELLAQRDELLAALKALVDHPEDIMPSRLWDAARAAIAKATEVRS